MKSVNQKFFIKKGNNFPLISYILSEEIMRYNNISEDMLQNVAVTFSMINIENGCYMVANEGGDLIKFNEYKHPFNNEYALIYELKPYETQEIGKYNGEFVVDFLGDYEYKMTLPIINKIEINVIDAITKTTVV